MDANWHDWHWQLRHSIRTLDGARQALTLAPDEDAAVVQLFKAGGLPLRITPHFLKLIDQNDSQDPLRQQLIPRSAEFTPDAMERRDPLGEEDHEVVPHLVHRYPDRVLFLATDRCAAYCRFCTRKRWVGQGPTPKREQYEEAFEYIQARPQIKEIIFSGGDPFLLENALLDELLSRARAIPSIEILRFHTRMLTFAPMRIDADLIAVLKKHQPVFVVTHFNHPNEIVDDTRTALLALADCGISVLNQSVLLKGINDDAAVLEHLFRALIQLRVKPHYLHQCDVVKGGSQFRVPLKRAQDIVEQLRGHISGLCMPTFVIDIPGGFGKVPMAPSPIVAQDETQVFLRGFSGKVAAYPLD